MKKSKYDALKLCLIHYNSFCPDTQQCRKRKLKLKVALLKVRSCCKALFFSKSFTTNFAKFNAKLCTTCKGVTTWICFVVKKKEFRVCKPFAQVGHMEEKKRKASRNLVKKPEMIPFFWMLSSHTFRLILHFPKRWYERIQRKCANSKKKKKISIF